MLVYLQYLRGIAAMLVVVGHTLQLMSARFEPVTHPLAKHFQNTGAIGVDIFFVISGFIMFHIAPATQGPGATANFWLRRVIRVMPLYWVMTTVVVCFYLTGLPQSQIDLSADYLLKSYLLLPAESLRGWMEPVMPVGWTLIYEMFFYFSFGLALLLPERFRALTVTLGLGGLIAFGALAPGLRDASLVFATYSSTLLAEFLFGVWIARACRAGLTMPSPVAWMLLIGGLVVLSATYADDPHTRFLVSGIPAAAVVLGAVMLERHRQQRPLQVRSLRVLGDASYSLYLGHPVVLFGVSYATRFIGEIGLAAQIAFFCAAIAVQIAFSIVSYRVIERPATDYLNRRLSVSRRKPATAGAGG